MQENFNAVIADRNGRFPLELAGQRPVLSVIARIFIDQKTIEARPNAAEQVAAGVKAAAGGKCHENMYAN